MVPMITLAGLALIADSISSGYPVQLTHIGFGAGTYDPDGTEIAMTDEVVRKAIAAGTNFANQVRIYAIWDNNSQQSEVTEVGIYAGSTLFAVWSNSGGYPVAYKTLEVDLVAYYDFIVDQVPANVLEIVVDGGESALLSALAVHTTDDDAHPLYKKRITDIFCGTSTGAVNHFELTPSAILDQIYADYANGDRFTFKAHLTNTGPAFVSINDLAEVEFVLNGVSIPPGTIAVGKYYEVLFNDGEIHIVNSYGIESSSSNKLKNLLFNGDFSKDNDDVGSISFGGNTYYVSHVYGKRVAKNWYATSGDDTPHLRTYNTTLSVVRGAHAAISSCKSDKLLKIETIGGGLDPLYILNKNEEGSLYGRGINARISEISGKTLTVSFFAKTDRDCTVGIELVAEYGDYVGGTASAPVIIYFDTNSILSAEADGAYYSSTMEIPDLISGKVFDFTSNSLETFDFLSTADFIQLKKVINFTNGQDTTLYITDVQFEIGEVRTEFENPEKQLQGNILNALSGTLDLRLDANEIRGLLGLDASEDIFLGSLLEKLRNGIDEYYDNSDLSLNSDATCGRRTIRIYLDSSAEWNLSDNVVEIARTVSNTNIEIFIKPGISLKLNTAGGYGSQWIFNNSSLRIYGGSSGSSDDLVIDMSLAVNGVPFIEFVGDSYLVIEDSVSITAYAPYARPVGGWGEYTLFQDKYVNSFSWIGNDNLSYERLQYSYSTSKFKTDESLGSITQDDTITLVDRFGSVNSYNGRPELQAISTTPFWKYEPFLVADIRNNKSVEYSGFFSGGDTFNLCSLAFDPDIVLVWLFCNEADQGYNAGNRIPISSFSHDVSLGLSYNINYYAGMYYLSFKISSQITVVHGSTGNSVNIDFAKWKIGAKLVHIPDAYIE